MSNELVTIGSTVVCVVAALLFLRRAVLGQRELHAQNGLPVDVAPTLRFVSRMSSFATLFATLAVLLATRTFDRWYVAIGVFVVLRLLFAFAVARLGRPRG